MRHQVIVSFGRDKDYEFKLSAADVEGISDDAARQWFEREFEALQCDVASPIGKILLADRILCVAKYAGERRFKEQHDWAGHFARNAAALMGRELIRVDVANYAIGY